MVSDSDIALLLLQHQSGLRILQTLYLLMLLLKIIDCSTTYIASTLILLETITLVFTTYLLADVAIHAFLRYDVTVTDSISTTTSECAAVIELFRIFVLLQGNNSEWNSESLRCEFIISGYYITALQCILLTGVSFTNPLPSYFNLVGPLFNNFAVRS